MSSSSIPPTTGRLVENQTAQSVPSRFSDSRNDSLPSDFPRHLDLYTGQDDVHRSRETLQSPGVDSRSRNPSGAFDQDNNSNEAMSSGWPLNTNLNSIPGSGSSHLLYRGTTSRHHSSSSTIAHLEKNHPQVDASPSETKKCWICYDDDNDDEPVRLITDGTLNPSQKRQKSRLTKRKWVKACQCSLMAHESCLLTWITTYQLSHAAPSAASPLATPVNCPQCATPYQIAQPAYPLLTLLYRLKRPYDTTLSWSALGCVILGIGVTTSSYGLWASRCFLGPTRWRQWVSASQGGSLSFIKLFQLSLVGPILILNRTRQLDSVLPFLPVSLILSNLPPLIYDATPGTDNTQHISLDAIFPPEPALTLCLIPWARVGWHWIWTRVTNLVLKREYRSLEYLGLAYSSYRMRSDVDQVEDDEAVANDEDPLNDRAPEARARQAAENQVQPPLGPEVVLDYTSLRSVIRIGMEALIWPGAASLAGSLLLVLSRNRPWLLTLLGIRSFAQYQAKSSHRENSSHRPPWYLLSTSMSQLFNKIFGSKSITNSGPADFGIKTWATENVYMFRDNTSREDPVWWRNTLGGALLVLVKDVVILLEKVLRLRKLSQRRIIEVGQVDPIPT